MAWGERKQNRVGETTRNKLEKGGIAEHIYKKEKRVRRM
jgi:hypothetical protein